MKTPEQTARDLIGADALAGVGYERDLLTATKAIAYDRDHTVGVRSRPDDVAQDVLDAHAIRYHFRRDGIQVKALIAEAIIRDRRANLTALIGDLDVVRHHVDNTYEAAEGDSNDAEIALLQEVRDLYEQLLVQVGGPWRDEWPDDPAPAPSDTLPADDVREALVSWFVGQGWRDYDAGAFLAAFNVSPRGTAADATPLTDDEIAVQASAGIVARWTRQGYTRDEADDIREDAYGAAHRALRIARGETVE